MEYAAYLLYRAAIALLAALPLRVNFALGKICGAVAFFLAAPYRKLVLRNLRIAFGDEKSPREIRALAREHFAALGANLFSSIKVAAMPPQKIRERVTLENVESLFEILRRGDGVVMVISHIGNWELFAQLAHVVPEGFKFSTVYQPLGNHFIDEHVKKTRARFGVVPFGRKEGFNAPIRFLREGGLVGVLVDQHAGDGGLWTPFFGRLASTSPLAATLSARTGATLVPVAIYTDGIARWRVVVSAPIPHENSTPEQLTAKINQALEQQIRVSPRDWFWVHNRWKTPNPKFLLAGYKRGIELPENFPVSKLKPFRILIRSTNWLGDAVMSAPAVRAIKRGRPDSRVSILTKSKLADFWKTVAEIDEVISIAPNEGLFRVAKKIAREHFDIAILFPNSVRAAAEAWLAGVPHRVGYRAKWRAFLMNRFIRENETPHPPEHQSLHYLRIAETIGAEKNDAAAAENFKFQISNSKFLALCPGAEYGSAKRWLPERFAEVAQQILEKNPACEWLLFGVEKDAEIGGQIASVLGAKCKNLIGKTTLSQLIERLRECRLLLTNDTGTMHLAAHLGMPTVSIFGSTEPALTGPLGGAARNKIMRHHVACSPCFLRECPLDFRCMKSVSVEAVAAAVLDFLKD